MTIKLKDGREIPTLVEHAGPRPAAGDAQFQKYRNGTLTPTGKAAFDAAIKSYEPKEAQWNKLYGKQIENEGEQDSRAITKQTDLDKYRGSPEGKDWDLYKKGAYGTVIPSTGVNYLIGHTAPAGTPLQGRLAKLVPFGLESALVGGLHHVVGEEKPERLDDPHGYDTSQTIQNALRGWEGGPVIAGAHKAFGTWGQTPEVPQGGGNGPQGGDIPPETPPVGPQLSPNGQKTVNAARAAGYEGNSHSDAHTFLKGKLASGDLSPAEKSAVRSVLEMGPNHTFTNALKKIAPIAGGALALNALAGDDASAGPARDESITGYRARRLQEGLGLTPEGLHHWFPPVAAYDVGSAAGGAVNALSQSGSVMPQRPGPDPRVVTGASERPPIDPAQIAAYLSRTPDGYNLAQARQEDARQRQELMSAGRIPIGSEAFRNLQSPGAGQPQNALAGAFAGGVPSNAFAPQGNPQQQTQAPSPIQRPQSIPAEPQEAEAPPRPTPKVPEDYTPGPLQRKQEKMIENALRQKEQERMMQNELALQGPDGNFYRALQAFQQHFAGAGAAAAGAR